MLKYIRILLLIFIGLTGIWLIGFIYFIHSMPSVAEDFNTKTDAIVVLTGGKGRIDEGITLLGANKAKKLLISGVAKCTKLEEIHTYTYNKAKLLSDKITLGYSARDTKGNVKETIKWMEDNNFKTIRLVTSGYHMPRACLEFEKVMNKKNIIFNPVLPENINLNNIWDSPAHIKLIAIEYCKFIWLYIRYNFETRNF